MKRLFLSFLFICLAGSLSAHKFYVSISQLHYNEASKSLEITIKLFTDDLEAALNSYVQGPLHLGTEKEMASANDYIAKYLKDNFQISTAGKPQEMEFIGKETDFEVSWCYLEVHDVAAEDSVHIKSRIFLELFDTQTNIVHFDRLGKMQSDALNRAKDACQFQ